MDALFGPDGNVEVFMDDIAIFITDSFHDHLEALHNILLVLSRENFCVNKAKCTFAVSEENYLGHVVTTTGIKPQVQKVSAILNVEEPKNVKQLRSFISLINYYRDFIPQRSHVLAPLTSLNSPKFRFISQPHAKQPLRTSNWRWPHLHYSPIQTHIYLSSSNPTQATTSWEALSANILLYRKLMTSSKSFLPLRHLRFLTSSARSPFLAENCPPYNAIILRLRKSSSASSKRSQSTAPSYMVTKYWFLRIIEISPSPAFRLNARFAGAS